jgi:hypothetical protein
MSSSFQRFGCSIHVRDFIDSITPDPVRPSNSRSLQVYTDLNIPYLEDFASDDVKCQSIPTYVRSFLPAADIIGVYVPDAFFSAWGPFIASIKDNNVELLINAYELDRYALSPLFMLYMIKLMYLGIPVMLTILKNTRDIVLMKHHQIL